MVRVALGGFWYYYRNIVYASRHAQTYIGTSPLTQANRLMRLVTLLQRLNALYDDEYLRVFRITCTQRTVSTLE